MAVGNEPDPRLREQTMGELFKELSNDLSTLVRQELKLAQVEMTEKGRRAGPAAGMLGGAGVAALAGLGTLSACLIAALAKGMDVWLAALIVTAIYAASAAVLAMRAKRRAAAAAPPVPEQTIDTVKEDVQWAKTQLSSGSK
jgi:uncharacterized membrane protein YqjE